MTLPDKSLSWPIAWAAVEEIARSESCRLTAYRCPAGVPTIGWGRTRGVRMGDTCTQAQADRWLLEDIAEAAEGVRSKLARSPIAVSGGLSIAAALAALVGQDSEQAAAVAAALGVDPVFGVVIVAAWSGAVAVYNRIKQRRQGWA